MMNPRQLINQQIKGHFIPTELMNRSDESFTYKAVDTRSQKKVILKFYPPQESKNIQEDIVNALRFQASHRGPRIVPVIDFGPHASGGNWIVTELQEQRVNLLRYVRSQPQGMLSPTQTIAILSALCDSLDLFHEQNIFHGNLKPTNIFLKNDGDLSSLRISDSVGSTLCGVHKTDTGRLTFNDPTFFSYEQASGKEATVQTDLCALGLIGYFMLTGNLPFEGRTTDKLLAAVIIGSGRLKLDPQEFLSESAHEPNRTALSELLSSCYAKSSSKRPLNASKLKAKLTVLGAPSVAASIERSSAPQTIAPGDSSAVLLGARGPQTMMYQSVDDDAFALLEAARAEFQSQYGDLGSTSNVSTTPSFNPSTQIGGSAQSHAPITPQETVMSMGKVPIHTETHQIIQNTPISPSSSAQSPQFQTLMGLKLSPEELSQIEYLDDSDTTPPDPQVVDHHDQNFDFEFDMDAISRSMEEALLDVGGDLETSLEINTHFEPHTLINAGYAGTESINGSSLLESPVNSLQNLEEEKPYFEMHTTSSPSLEFPFATPSSFNPPDHASDHHVELFSEPARILPPEPATSEHEVISSSSYEHRSPAETLISTQSHQTLSFDTYLEGLSAEEIFPQIPAWQELMALQDQPQALTEALTRIKVPLTGLLLPFSQFQLQLEGHCFEEPFFNEPIQRLSLEQLIPPVPSAPEAELLSAQVSAAEYAYTTGSFESSPPSVISAVVEGSKGTSSSENVKKVPTTLLVLVLLSAMIVGIYASGAHEFIAVLLDTQEHPTPSPQKFTPRPPTFETALPPATNELDLQAVEVPINKDIPENDPQDDFAFDEPIQVKQEKRNDPSSLSKMTPSEKDTKERNTTEKKEVIKRSTSKPKQELKTKSPSTETNSKQERRASKAKRSSKTEKTKEEKTIPGLKSVF